VNFVELGNIDLPDGRTKKIGLGQNLKLFGSGFPPILEYGNEII